MNVLTKIVHIFLASLLLLSTSGVTLHKHYCMGELRDIAFFHEAESCIDKMRMDEGDKPCSKHCCEDVEEEFKVTDLNKVVSGFSLVPDLRLVAVLHYIFIDFNTTSSIAYTSRLNYKPPLIDPDIPVMVQSFLL